MSIDTTTDPADVAGIHREGIAHQQAGRLGRAQACFRRVIEARPNHADALHRMGLIAYQAGQYAVAVKLIVRAIGARPKSPAYVTNLGLALSQQGKAVAATKAFRRALELDPDFPEAHNNLGATHRAAGRYRKAAASYQRAIAARPTFSAALYNLGEVNIALHEWDLAVAAFERFADGNPAPFQAYYAMGNAYRQKGDVDAALDAYRRADEADPTKIRAAWSMVLTVPAIYDSEEQIAEHGARWWRGMAKLHETLDLGSPAKRAEAMLAVQSRVNFLLHYQGHNVRDEQRQFGDLIQRVTSAAFPQYAKPLAKRKIAAGDKIRIGFVSSYLCHHSVYKTRGGWIKYLDRDKFEVHTFYTGTTDDYASTDIKQHSDYFHHYTDDDSVELLRMISDAKLDVLGFPDIGMEPRMQFLASLRLAPVQFMGWAHPITSGQPTVDYFVSNELMEPENAQDQYTEELVLLPRLGICYPYPLVPDPPGPKDSATTGRFVYFCSQSLFKLLPQHDDIFARIAKRVPDSELWFVGHQRSKTITQQFRQRLERAFEKHGVDSEGRIVIHDRVPYEAFLELNQRADVLLDSVAWSGCNTTFEGLAAGLPVITMPGTVMRARHSYGILKAIGLDECIAASKDEYVELAVRFAEDAEWRRTITKKFHDNHRKAFMDRDCVRALGDWLQTVCSA